MQTIDQLQKRVEKIPQLEQRLEEERSDKAQYQGEVERLNKVIKDKTSEVQRNVEKSNHLEA